MQRVRGRARVNGALLAYERVGSGLPVVFVPPLVDGRRIWDNQVTAFAERFEMIRYDLRGYGRSSLGPAIGRSVWDLAPGDLLSLLDALRVRATALVAYSDSAEIVLRASLARPTCVRALVLIAPSVEEVTRRVIDTGIPSMMPHGVPPQYNATDRKAIRDSVLHHFVVRIQNVALEKLRAGPRQAFGRYLGRSESARPILEALRSLQIPTLIVNTDRDSDFTEAKTNVLCAALPRAEREVIPRATSIFLPLVPAEALNRVVLDFLASHYI
jgi:pimeloyl-ACP methyl ester carboxylesterase